jgi:hypothetical protein
MSTHYKPSLVAFACDGSYISKVNVEMPSGKYVLISREVR